MVDDPGFADPINSFSLVSYIPGELGEFLNQLRQELAPGCLAQAHVTVLPPRPLAIDAVSAGAQLQPLIEVFPSFEVWITGLRIFEKTDVIYADIGVGRGELQSMHAALNRGDLGFDAPHPYHPHITLAQSLPPEDLEPAFALAMRRWNASGVPRKFEVTTLTFVQNTSCNIWVDLLACELRGAPTLYSR